MQRVFSGIKAFINFVTLEQGLECQNAFAKVYPPSNNDAKKIHEINSCNIAKIKAECLAIDDDVSWLVAIVVDSGMGLSEAAGLMIYDLMHHINLVPRTYSCLKTASDERKISLAGCRYEPQSVSKSNLRAFITFLVTPLAVAAILTPLLMP